jgi:hypothetical protein
MAHEARLSNYVGQGVAQDTILEGKLVVATTSGIRAELPNVRLAASGVTRPVYVAFAAPDNFPRPVNSLQYTAGNLTTFRGDVNTGWADPVDQYTMYRVGLASLENPVLTSGMLVQLHRDGTYTLPSGCWVDVAGIKVREALVKVADDGTGRFQLTTVNSSAVGWVEEYDATRNYLTVTLF